MMNRSIRSRGASPLADYQRAVAPPVIQLRDRQLFWLLLGLLLSMNGCRPVPVPTMQAIHGETMGTSYSVKFVPSTGVPAIADVSDRIAAELELVNDQMSTYISTSELSRFNDQQSTEWFDVSPETAEVTQVALEVHRLTEGAFDVTVGPLVDLWGFGPQRRPAEPPEPPALLKALESVGSNKLQVRSDPPALRKTVPGLRVDLSAIAKGHGVDRVAKVLDELRVQSYFIEIGGEIRTRGRRLDERAWQVGIERPSESERAVQMVVGITDRSLATSGDYRNFHDSGNQRITHFIDPRTGRPSAGEIASASVIADNCALADALATGLMVTGFDEGLQLAKDRGWAVLLIARRNGQFVTAATEGFDQVLADESSTMGVQP